MNTAYRLPVGSRVRSRFVADGDHTGTIADTDGIVAVVMWDDGAVASEVVSCLRSAEARS